MSSNYSIIVKFGDSKTITKKVGDFPADDYGFIKWFASVFEIPITAITPKDKKIILDAIKTLSSEKNEIIIKIGLTLTDINKSRQIFRNLSEFFLHFLRTNNHCFWINYATWKDFLIKINSIFIHKNPPKNLRQVVIYDSEKSILYDLSKDDISVIEKSDVHISNILKQISTQKDSLYILEDLDILLETDNNYGGEQYQIKTRLKNILDSNVLIINNSYIIVAAGASDRITIPKQLKGYWISYQDSSSDFPILEGLGVNITAQAKTGSINKIIGREGEINNLINKLTKENYNTALIVGKAGVGKTAIVKGLALAIVNNQIPDKLKNVQIFEIPFSNLLSDTGTQGSLESRLSGLIEEVKSHKNEVIIFFDEFHQLYSNETIRNSLKPPLSSGEFPCIGATTEQEFQQYISGVDSALEQRFNKVIIDELPKEVIISILKEQVKRSKKKINISNNEIEYLYWLNKKLDPMKALPRSGEKILGNLLERLDQRNKITKNDIKNEFILGAISLRLSKKAEFKNLINSLSKIIKGQHEQIVRVLTTIRKHLFVLTKVEKPLVILFMGPTGTGKTEFAIQLSRVLWNNDDRYLLFNMGSVDHKTSITGAPPGYIGYENSSPILNFIANKDSGIIILDEFEKVRKNEDVLDSFLEIFDKGTTSDNRGIKLNCRPFIFILTSNLGENLPLNYTKKDITDLLTDKDKGFKKEFIGRISIIEVFNKISKNDAIQLIKDFVDEYNNLPDIQCKFKLDNSSIENILKSSDFETFGARNLKKVFSEHLHQVFLENIEKLDTEIDYVVHFDSNKYIMKEDT